jgi:phosphoribosylamine--glycine ligase
MGTITDDSLLTADQTREIVDTIIRPTLHGCIRDGFPFRGILFLGLMMTNAGPKVLEYNVRFGDPETQSIIVRLKTDLVDICEAMLSSRLGDLTIDWAAGSSACVVLASEGYPAKARTGDIINGLDKAAAHENVKIFHSGTAFVKDQGGKMTDESKASDSSLIPHPSSFQTAGGRVLGVTATGADLASTLETAYAAVSDISWPGMQYRRDIGR